MKGVNLLLLACAAFLAIVGGPSPPVASQENDYRIIRGQRLGKYSLGQALQAMGLGRETSRWENVGRRGAFADAFWFQEAGIRVYTCKSDGLAFAVVAWPSQEGARYRTPEGIGIGSPEVDLTGALGPALSTHEETHPLGGRSTRLSVHRYSGLQVYVDQADARVVAIGVTTPGTESAWSVCERDFAISLAFRGPAQPSAVPIRYPVALTACEASELPRRLAAEATIRRLYGPIHARAEQALELSPSPLPRVFIEGASSTDPRFLSSTALWRDARSVEALGYAYAATGDARYARQASAFLEAWARTYQPDGNPINETEFSRMMRGLSLTASIVPPEILRTIEDWLTRMGTLQIESRATHYGGEYYAATGNHHSHRLKIVGMIGYATGNSRFIRYAEDGYRRQIADNLRPDGSSLDFERRDALHYHVYNLEALLELAIAADKHGTNLYGHRASSGASLDRSLAFLLPYVRGERVHFEFVRTTIDWDRQQLAAGTHLSGYRVGAPWRREQAAPLLESAGYFNPAFADEAMRVLGHRTFQAVLNELRARCSRR